MGDDYKKHKWASSQTSFIQLLKVKEKNLKVKKKEEGKLKQRRKTFSLNMVRSSIEYRSTYTLN